MPVKKLEVKSPKLKVETKPVKKSVGLSVPVYSLDGKLSGKLELPKESFGAKVNKDLLTQAARVYLNNQTSHNSHTKTRSEVKGSTRKIYRQKGTGGARHGSKRAPIFVGGGIALGPKSRKTTLELPQKMRQAAVTSALSLRASEGQVIGISGLEKVKGKTSQIAQLLKKIEKNSALFLLGERDEKLVRAAKNLPSVNVTTTGNLNTLEILKHQTIVLTKETITKLGGQK